MHGMFDEKRQQHQAKICIGVDAGAQDGKILRVVRAQPQGPDGGAGGAGPQEEGVVKSRKAQIVRIRMGKGEKVVFVACAEQFDKGGHGFFLGKERGQRARMVWAICGRAMRGERGVVWMKSHAPRSLKRSWCVGLARKSIRQAESGGRCAV